MNDRFELEVNDDYNFDSDALNEIEIISKDSAQFTVLDNELVSKVELKNKDFNAKVYVFEINGNQYRVSLKDSLDVLINKLGFSKVDQLADNEVKAPMPGLIISVSVTEGQQVSQGDDLLVLEAMKMENMLTSPKDGVVKSISVTNGATVDKGQLLIEME